MRDGMGSTWITVVLFTVIAILLFLVFFGPRTAENPSDANNLPAPLPIENKSTVK